MLRATLGIALFLLACTRGPPAAVPLAEGRGIRLTDADLRGRLSLESPGTRTELTDFSKRREFFTRLVEQEVLVAEARRQKLDEDPEFQATVKQLLVQRLLAVHRANRPEIKTPSEGELQTAYESQKSAWTTGDSIRLQVLVVHSASTGPQAAAKRRQLEDLRRQLLPASNSIDEDSFAAGVRQHSEDSATAASGGDLGFRSRGELEVVLGESAVAEAFSLHSPGQVSPVLSSPQGFLLLRLSERRVGQPRSFAEVKPELLAQWMRKRDIEEVAQWTSGLREASSVRIFEEPLKAFEFDVAKR